ncbi:MAG: hypothetical protein HY862_16150 [Chloroflexi bacterium]|nr:hypothetical protein [Chloroflexota bacterium]
MKSSTKKQDAAMILGLLCFIAVIFTRFWTSWPPPLIYPNSELGGDLPRESYPLALYVKTSLLEQDTLPLWRPYLLSGAPLIGHPVAPVFYPAHWLVLILPISAALNLGVIFNLWWGAIGLYIYLRKHPKLSPNAAFVGAVIFAYSPKWIGNIAGGFYPMVAALAWWPWIWLAFHTFWKKNQYAWLVLMGIGLAAQALNDGRLLAQGLTWLGFCTLGYVKKETWHEWLLKALSSWSITLVLMITLAAVELFPLLELLPETNRTNLSLSDASFGSLPPILLLGTFFPPRLQFPEWIVYPGVITLLLLIMSWSRGEFKKRRWWIIGVLTGIMMSFGSYTPIYRILFEIPGFSFFRVPARWWLFSLFSFAVLAAFSIQEWEDNKRVHSTRLKPILTLLIPLYLIGAVANIVLSDAIPFVIIPSAIAFFVSLIILQRPNSHLMYGCLILTLLFDLGWTSNTLIKPEPPNKILKTDAMTKVFENIPNLESRTFAPYTGLPEVPIIQNGLSTADGYDSFQLTAYAQLGLKASGCNFKGFAVAVPPTRASQKAVDACPNIQPDFEILQALNIGYIVLPVLKTMPGATPIMFTSKQVVYRLDMPPLGRAYGVVRGERINSMHSCIEQAGEIDLSKIALVEKTLDFRDGLEQPIILEHLSVVNSETFEVYAKTDGLLVRSETWAPGWQVKIDGQDAEVLRVDCALQGVWVEAGDHTIRFEYAPRSYLIGRWISLFSALAVFTWGIWYVLVRRGQ